MDVCTPPKVDKHIPGFLSEKFPKEHDSEAIKIQALILTITCPLASGWKKLLEAGLETNPDLLVPAGEVLNLIQCTLCLVENTSEYISDPSDKNPRRKLTLRGANLAQMKFQRPKMLCVEKSFRLS